MTACSASTCVHCSPACCTPSLRAAVPPCGTSSPTPPSSPKSLASLHPLSLLPPPPAPPSIHTHGYTWSTFLCLTARRDAPNNVFRFFNDVGFGLQVAVRGGGAVVVRTLPVGGDAVVVKGVELEEGRWVHLAVTHKPLPRPPQTAATAQQVRRAGGGGGGGFIAPPSPSLATPATPSLHAGVFVVPSPSSSSAPYSSLHSPQHSPPSPQAHLRPGRFTLYVDGQPTSALDLPFPNLDSSDNLQCTLGGLYGRMSAFFLFADVLPPSTIAALHALGAGAVRGACHACGQRRAGGRVPPPPPLPRPLFPPPPLLPQPPGGQGPVPAATTRTVARCLLAQSPAQTTHSVCLPYTWPDDAPPAAPHTPLTTAPASATINQCLHHTLRLDGITVVYRQQNAQTLAVLGGLKLLVLSLSPLYYGAPSTAGDDDACELLLLLASLILSSESHAHLLLEVGAAACKSLFFDPLKRRAKTLRLLAALRHFLLAVHRVDATADRFHFASFTSALLLDAAFWGKAPLQVQAASVRLIQLLYAQCPAPFLTFASLGVPRLMDNLLALNVRYISPPTANPNAPPSTLASPASSAREDVGGRNMSAAGEKETGMGDSNPLLVVVVPHPVPSAEEVAISASVVDLILTFAKASLTTPTYEKDCVAPFLHLLQACLASHAASVEPLLTLLLRALLHLITHSTPRTLTHLFRQQSHYIFLRLLYSDSAAVRVLGLRLLGFLNVHCMAAERAERDKKMALDYNQLQADIAQAIVSALALFPVGAEEHEVLWAVLMGQTPALREADGVGGAPGEGAERGGAGGGGHLEAGVAFCHPAYLSMILELSLLSPLPLQSKVLVDVLMLLRTNPSNVDGLAALFWQRLLLPFSSRMHHNPALVAYNSAPPTPASSLTSPASPSPSAPAPPAPPSPDASEPAVTPHTVDQLVHQILNLMLLNCMTNEPKGWQVLDQCIWCLQEKNSLLAAMPPQVQALSTPHLTLARTVHDTWVLQMSILYRLFHSLHRHLALLSGARRPDSVAAYNEAQVSNLRRNMLAVLELTEWILFHSPCSFLTAPTQLALGVPDVEKLPVATRAGDTMDEQTREEAIRDMLTADREGGTQASSDDLPGGPGGAEGGEGSEGGGEAAGGEGMEEGEGQPAGDIQRSSSSASTSSSSSTPLTSAALLKTDSLPSSATILRASQRGVDEPLTAEETEIFTLLLTGMVDQFPMPDKRQDVLRIIFRYLMVVLPHPLCAPLTPPICDSVQRLFLERVTERVEKNTRLVALTLSLLKSGMDAAIRRQDLPSVERIKQCIGALYRAWGEVVFLDQFQPQVHQSQWAAPTAAGGGQGQGQRLSAVGQPVAAASTFPSTTPLPSAAAAPAAASAPAASSASPPSEADLVGEASEAALFRLYQGDGRAVMQSTQTVFLQHQQRFSYLSEVRAAKVHASIVDYLRRKRAAEAQREKKFSLGSTLVLRASQQARTFLLQHYAVKKGRAQWRWQEREEKQLVRVSKAIKQFRGQALNSRPLPLPLPPPHPDLLRSHLQAVKDALNHFPAPTTTYPYSTPSSLCLLTSHSRLVDFWKLDSTESPTRMRRLLKKNFTSGDPHTYASANATSNAAKQIAKANEAIDLMRVKLTTTGKGGGAEGGVGEGGQGGVDANADVDGGGEKEREAAKAAEAEKAKLLAAAEADDDDLGGEDEDEGGDAREAEAEEDDVDEGDVEEGAGGVARVKRSSKVVLQHFATMITPTHKFIGLMKLTTTSLSFSGIEHVTLAGAETAPPPTSAPSSKLDGDDGDSGGRRKRPKLREKHIRWSLRQLRMVLPRFFLLRESALEMFLNNFKNYFFNFTPLPDDVMAPLLSQPAYASALNAQGAGVGVGGMARQKKWKSGREQRNEVYRLLCTLVPDMQFELSPGRRLLKSGIMKAWQRGEVSNFDYLMHLNTIAGRSYNDINQYPVFPWILTDYKSAELDLDDPSIYRDLSKPIGALNADRFDIFQERFQGFEDETIPPFLYGSHYSSAGIALHYLIRMEPFTSLAISLQGGRFDLPDRLFDSIAGSWELSYSNMADVKELIPEFFYCFPVADHQVLTSRGFLYQSEVKQWDDDFKAGALDVHGFPIGPVMVACPVEPRVSTGKHSYGISFRPMVQLVDVAQAATELVEFRSRPRAQGRRSDYIDLQLTGNHTLPVQLDDGQWEQLTASAVVDSGASTANLLFYANEGAHPPFKVWQLSFVRHLSLRTEAQIDAFIELYGYWIGDGSWQAIAVTFKPNKPQDWAYLDDLLDRLGIPLLQNGTRAEVNHDKNGYKVYQDNPPDADDVADGGKAEERFEDYCRYRESQLEDEDWPDGGDEEEDAAAVDAAPVAAEEEGEEDVEEDPQRCFSCGDAEWEYGNEMLLCDDCDSCGHVRCAGLRRVPARNWYRPTWAEALQEDDDEDDANKPSPKVGKRSRSFSALGSESTAAPEWEFRRAPDVEHAKEEKTWECGCHTEHRRSVQQCLLSGDRLGTQGRALSSGPLPAAQTAQPFTWTCSSCGWINNSRVDAVCRMNRQRPATPPVDPPVDPPTSSSSSPAMVDDDQQEAEVADGDNSDEESSDEESAAGRLYAIVLPAWARYFGEQYAAKYAVKVGGQYRNKKQGKHNQTFVDAGVRRRAAQRGQAHLLPPLPPPEPQKKSGRPRKELKPNPRQFPPKFDQSCSHCGYLFPASSYTMTASQTVAKEKHEEKCKLHREAQAALSIPVVKPRTPSPLPLPRPRPPPRPRASSAPPAVSIPPRIPPRAPVPPRPPSASAPPKVHPPSRPPSPPPSPEPDEPDITKSAKPMLWWVWCLDARRLRLLLRGLRFADGNQARENDTLKRLQYSVNEFRQAGDQKKAKEIEAVLRYHREEGWPHRGANIVTTSRRSRDQYQRVALLAGFTCTWRRSGKKGDKSGDGHLTADKWNVAYRVALPTLDAAEEIKVVLQASPVPVWCVEVPEPHLIIVRRVTHTEGAIITGASRPTIMGNSADFLRNVNHLDLGTKQDHTKLGDVILPPWASSPEEFVRLNREALESDHVSAHLHEWIDLIFGYKQKGRAAVDAANVFFYLTYAGSVDIDAIDNVALRKATEDQIANFGQTPMQLLTSPHPRRFTAAERAKVSQGKITLPLRLPAAYTSQLICNYPTPPRRRRTVGGGGGSGVGGAKEDRGGEEERRLPPVLLPTSLCFTHHDVVIAVTPDLGIQSHALAAFLNAPPTLLYPAHEHMQGIWQTERDAAAPSSSLPPASSAAPSPPPPSPPTWQGVNRRGPGMGVDLSASKSPSAAQFIPGVVVASHLLHPMCPHWFLSPTPIPSSTTPTPSPTTPPTTSTPPSSSSADQRSRALPPHSSRELYHSAVSVVAKNAKFIFTAGYFDGSIKCHALVHSKAHIEGEGGMGGGQGSQHVMAALAAKSSDPSNLQRPAPKTQPTLDIKPLSSVRQHRAVVTAMTLSSNQMVLVSGDADGVVCIWRVYLDRQERARPPIASSPLAAFAVHEGAVVSVDTNAVIGIAVSLAQDVQRRRGCELGVMSIRGGAARWMHSVVVHDAGADLQMVALTATANIVVYGVAEGGVPTLWLYSLNGYLLTSTPTHDVLTVLTTTPNLSRTVNANDGLIVTGGRRGQVVCRQPHNLELVQTFFTDDQFPHTVPHGLPAAVGGSSVGGGGGGEMQPTAVPVGSGGAGEGGGSAFGFIEDGEGKADGGGGGGGGAASPGSAAGGDEWTLVEGKDEAQAKRKALAADAQAAALQFPPDPTLESIYTDPSLPLVMGIAAIDISRTQKHLVAAVHPDPDLVALRLLPPSHPLAPLYSGESQASTAEGRLLLFPLPFSIDPTSFLGFYVDYAASALESLRDSVNASLFVRISETRDMALEAVDRARDRLGGQREQANKKMTEVKSKVFGALNSLFGGPKKPPTPHASGQGQQQGGGGAASSQPGTGAMRGGMMNAPVARAVPRQGQNL